MTRRTPETFSDRRTFDDLSARGVKSRAGTVTIVYLKDEGPPRVAYAVGRRVGSAVVRNKVKRRLREIVRSLADKLPGGAYLIIAAPGAARRSYEQLYTDVERALARYSSEARGE